MDDSILYELIRSKFTAIEPASKEEHFDLISSVFAGDDFWGNQREHYFLEPEFEDQALPLRRFMEQKPVISSTTFTLKKKDLEDRQLIEYTKFRLTKSKSQLLTVNYVMCWFFLKNFNLLPVCMGSNAKEKVLRRLETFRPDWINPPWRFADLLSPEGKRGFDLSPVILCGALCPSEMLSRAAGRTSVIVFPYYCMDWNDDYDLCSVTAYLIEFPQPIEPVYNADEIGAFYADTVHRLVNSVE